MCRRFDFQAPLVRSVCASLCVLGIASSALAEAHRSARKPVKKESQAGASSERSGTDHLRHELRTALSRPFPAAQADVGRQARELLALYRQLAESPVSSSERGRWRTRLKGRLVGLSKAIAKDEPPAAGAAAVGSTALESDAASSHAGSRAVGRGGAGGAARSNAQELIELIESTIAPETWEANGGRGTIKYWEPGLALVVRQTDDVHEQLGGVLRRLGDR